MSKQPDKLKIIDYDLARQQLGWQEDIVRNMLTIFVGSLDEEIENLRQAFERQDWVRVKSVAHKLRGGAKYCAAIRLQKVCKELEEAIVREKYDHLDAIYHETVDEIKLVKREVNKE